MTDVTSSRQWAEQEFGDVQLGDARRVKTLLRIAEAAAQRPAGCATRVARTPAEKEAIYRFTENAAVSPEAITEAAGRASARRVGGHQFVFVPVDATSLNLKDDAGLRGMGTIGDPRTGSTGLLVMNAIVVEPDGTPAGIGTQVYFKRPPKLHKNTRKQRTLAERRPFADKEVRHWMTAIDKTSQVFKDAGAGDVVLWFQLDRFADFREMLKLMTTSEHLLTVRAGRKRIVVDSEGGKLDEVMKQAPVRGRFKLRTPYKGTRRTATLAVRSKRVVIQLRATVEHPVEYAQISVVLVEEVGPRPADAEPLQWLLLTNADTDTFQELYWVVYGYSRRWVIEEFHRAWKSITRVEDNQMRGQNVLRWANILASVAMRAERLKHLDRNEPDVEATREFSRDEIDATILLAKPKGFAPGDTPTLRDVITWIAILGGYTGRAPSRGPPGTVVIARGLERVMPLVDGLAALREFAKEKK